MKQTFVALTAAAFVAAPSASVAATIGKYVFDLVDAADGLNVISGTVNTFTAEPGPNFAFDVVSPSTAISDGDFDTNVYCAAACEFEVLFTDNAAFNNSGIDIVLFEEGGNEDIQVTINGTTIVLPGSSSIPTGVLDAADVAIDAYEIDLSDFGVADGASITSFFIDPLNSGPTFSSADISEIVANPTIVPLPAAGWMLVAGLAGLGWVARRKTA